MQVFQQKNIITLQKINGVKGSPGDSKTSFKH